MNYKILFSRSVAQSLSRLPIRACSLIIFLFLTSCQKNNDASDLHAEQKVQKFSPEVESSIANIVAIVSQNSNSIKAMYRSSNDGVSLRNGDFDEVTQETESGLRQFQKDPNSLLRQIAAEAQGAEKIALIEGLMSIKDAETLRKLYAPFGTIDDMPNLRGNLPNELQLRSCPLDCRLH